MKAHYILAAVMMAVPATARAVDPCPTGNPLNCHPGFEACNGETLGDDHPFIPPIAGLPLGGGVRLLNNDTTLNLELTASGFYNFAAVHVHLAPTLSGIPASPAAYSFHFPVPGYRGSLNLSIPMFTGSSAYVAVAAEMVMLDPEAWDPVPVGTFQLASPVYYSNLCTLPCSTAPGGFRTQTQGGWGAVANGGNPGAYRDANFDGAFPNDLVVGCSKTARFTSSAAVEAFLPAGGPAAALKASVVDPPDKSIKNVLAGQVTALALSIGFDAVDASFGGSGLLLRDLVLADGTFAGWTVQALFEEANRALGACSSAYSFAELNAAVSDVNENFVDGTEAGTALTCPAD